MMRAAMARLSRRAFLAALAAAPAAAAGAVAGAVDAARPPATAESGRGPRRRVVVIGAGAFGAFTALALARRGARVTLVDAWGPGNARSSSGGEARVIRGVYGERV